MNFFQAAEKAAVKKTLLETLSHLNYWELVKFRWLLQFTCYQRSLPQLSSFLLYWTDTADLLVDLMVGSHGQQSVEVTKDVLVDMNRTDLVQLLETSFKLKGKTKTLIKHNMCLEIKFSVW